jgi:cytoplasmic iron level regulating protein YaaA (DUF328/UPF0246 family)
VRLPQLGTVQSVWGRELSDALAREARGLVVDLRSGAYQKLGPVAGALTATVVTEKPDGTRRIVSHHNKSHKGLLARALFAAELPANSIDDVAATAEAAGLRVEIAGPTELVLIAG